MTNSPEDYEKLLAQIESTSRSQSTPPARARTPESPARQDKEGGGVGGRLAFGLVAGAALGVGGWFFGLVMPFMSATSMGFGAAGAAFITALVAGPPRWFSS